MRRALLTIAAVALGLAAACGGGSSTSCNDACQSLVTCLNTLDITNSLDVPTCTTQCNAGTCANKQQFIDCVHAAQCTNSDAYEAAITTCETQTGCSIGG